METAIEYAGLKWSKKPSGYYQSTVRTTDRKNWLHQFVYEEANGTIPDGYEVHHRDHNKDNNKVENLELLSTEEHKEAHAEQQKRNGEKLAEYVAENFDEVQGLAKQGKAGTYVGKRKRKLLP